MQRTLLGIIALCMLVQTVVQLANNDLGDFPVFLGAAERLQEGGSPYLTWFPTRNGNALQFVYPPLAAWVFAPLTAVTPPIAFLLWSLLRTVLLLRTIQILLRPLTSSASAGWRAVLFHAVVLVVVLRFALDDLALGQWTIVLFFLSVEAVHRSQLGKEREAALLIALGASLKLLPLVLLPGLLLLRRWRTFGWTVLFGIALTFLPMIQFGPTHMRSLLEQWTLALDPKLNTDIADSGANNLSVHGLSGMLRVYLQVDPAIGDGPALNIVDLDDTELAVVLNVLRLLLLLGALLFRPGRASPGSNNGPWPLFAYLLLVAPLIFPHQQKYAFLFIVPATLLVAREALVADPLEQGARRHWLIALFLLSLLCMIASMHGVLGDRGYQIAQQTKLLTWAALLLIPALLIGTRQPKAPPIAGS